MRKGWRKKAFGSFGISDAARQQEAGQCGGKMRLLGAYPAVSA